MADEHGATQAPMSAMVFWPTLIVAAVAPFIVFNLPASLSLWGASVAVVTGLIVLVMPLAFYLFRNRSKPRADAQRTTILIAFALACIIGYGGYYGRTSDAAEPVAPVATLPATTPAADASEIRVVSSRQDSEGVTQDQLSPTFLRNLEAYTVERIRTLAAQAAKDQGHASQGSVITSSEAVYVEAGGKKLAVLRLEGSDKSSQVMVAGIVGSELVRVLCLRATPERVPLTYGPCNDKIKEAFGVGLSSGP